MSRVNRNGDTLRPQSKFTRNSYAFRGRVFNPFVPRNTHPKPTRTDRQAPTLLRMAREIGHPIGLKGTPSAISFFVTQNVRGNFCNLSHVRLDNPCPHWEQSLRLVPLRGGQAKSCRQVGQRFRFFTGEDYHWRRNLSNTLSSAIRVNIFANSRTHSVW